MIFESVLSAVAAVLLVGLSAYAISRGRTVANVAFCTSALLLVAVEVADALSLVTSADPFVFKRAAVVAESFLPMALLAYGLLHSRRRLFSGSPLWVFLLAAAAFFPVAVLLLPTGDFFYSPDFQSEEILFLGNAGYWFYMGITVYCIMTLINIEATLVASSGWDRWKLKFEAIGAGAILAALIFYYSQGLLYRTINMNLVPVRSSVLIIAALLIGYSKIFRGNGVKVAVSRYIVYRSLTLLLAGLYLLFLGLAGGGMRYLGIPFSKDLTIFIAFVGGMALLLIVFSERLRRRVKVFVNRNFFAHKHDYRDSWLNFTERLSSCRAAADVHEVVLSTYKETFELRGTALYLLDREKGTHALVSHLDMPGCPAEFEPSQALLSYFTERVRVLDALSDEYAPTPEEASFLKSSRAAFIVPLVGSDCIEGLVLCGERLVKEEMSYEDYDMMKTLAKQATLSVVNYSLSEELAETREVAAVARMSSFVVHDLKNLTYTLSLLLDNAEDNISEPEFQKDMVEAVSKSVEKMRRLAQRLRAIPEKQALNSGPADIGLLLQETVKELKGMRPGIKLLCEECSVVSVVDAEELRKVVLNLLLNAIEAAGEKGTVRAKAGRNGYSAFIRVEDDGCGMTEEFIRHHLFKPFRTTKNKGLGVGLFQCKQIVEAHGGKIEVSSEVGKGTTFTVCLSAEKNMDTVGAGYK